MILEVLNSGINVAPTLNYRSSDKLRNTIRSIESKLGKPFGIN